MTGPLPRCCDHGTCGWRGPRQRPSRKSACRRRRTPASRYPWPETNRERRNSKKRLANFPLLRPPDQMRHNEGRQREVSTGACVRTRRSGRRGPRGRGTCRSWRGRRCAGSRGGGCGPCRSSGSSCRRGWSAPRAPPPRAPTVTAPPSAADAARSSPRTTSLALSSAAAEYWMDGKKATSRRPPRVGWMCLKKKGWDEWWAGMWTGLANGL